MPPFGIASRAFTTRFITTCWSWPGSASIGPRARIELGRQHDVLADQRPEHRLHLDDDAVQVQELGRQHLLAAEREELAREQRRPVGRLPDLFEVRLAAASRRCGMLEREGGVAADRGQHVVEVVSHAAGESADRLELLALAKLLLEQLALGDVLGHPDREVRLAVGVAHERERKLGHDGPAVLGQEARFAPVGVMIAADQLPVQPPAFLGVVRVADLVGMREQRLVVLVPEQ